MLKLLVAACGLAICLPALAAPTTQAVARSEAIMADIDHFTLELKFHGNQDKPHYNLTLCAQPVEEKSDTFNPKVKISADDARTIFDHLATNDFLDNAIGVKETDGKIPAPTGPAYIITLRTTHLVFTEDLGWSDEMLERLEKLQKVFTGEPRQAMDLLVARLGGYRNHWDKPKNTELDSFQILTLAKKEIDEKLNWPLGGIYTVSFKDDRWNVLVWRVQGFQHGQPLFAAGGHRFLRIDKTGKIVDNIPGA